MQLQPTPLVSLPFKFQIPQAFALQVIQIVILLFSPAMVGVGQLNKPKNSIAIVFTPSCNKVGKIDQKMVFQPN
jgi:hypothetical protein